MRSLASGLLGAALLLLGCASDAPAPPPAESTTEALAESALVVVDMTLEAGLTGVQRAPQAMRRKLVPEPPQGLDVSALPEGDWSFGAAPLTKTLRVNYAISADRMSLWFDANRDGVLTADENHRSGRRYGRIVWHDRLETITRRSQDGVDEEGPVYMAVGAQAGSQIGFSRLDGYRSGVLRANGMEVPIALIDGTYRGWYRHLQRDSLLVDIDGDGRFDTTEESHERYRLGDPIPVGDASFVVKEVVGLGERLVFEPSEKKARRWSSLAIGSPAPELSGTALDGSEIRLSKLEGSWVFLDFWATWCGPCRMELPHLKKLKAEHPELVLLGISGDRQLQALESFLERDPLPWPQIYDENAPIRRSWRVRSLPTSYLIAPDGRIAAKNLRGSSMGQRYEREKERWEREQARRAEPARPSTTGS